MPNLQLSELLKPIPNNGGYYTQDPGPGQGTVRVPFVDLLINGQSIPLVDVGSFYETDVSSSELAERKPRLLLLDFRYKLTGFLAYGNEVSMTILDPQGDYLLSLLMNNNPATQQFTFRFGWRGIDDSVGSAFPKFFVSHFSMEQNTGFEGVRVELRGVDAAWTLYAKEVSHAYDPKTAISDVIADVIQRANPGLDSDVEAITTPVGETHNRIENMTPFAYIQTLLEVASGGPGVESDYQTVIRPGANGRDVVQITSDKPLHNIVRRYVFGREGQGTMMEFRAGVEGALYTAAGATKAVARAVDSATKQATVRTSTQQEDTSLARKKINETPNEPGKVYMVPWQTPEQVEGFLQGVRQMMTKHTMWADCVVHGDAGILPLSQVAIIALKPGTSEITDKSILFTSGVYRIESVEHIIAAGMFRTLFHVYRDSAPFGAEVAESVANVDLAVKDPGIDRVEKFIT